jgi:hypothetical protein
MHLRIRPSSLVGRTLARALWPLPPKAHDWMVRNLGGRPIRLGEHPVTYFWEPTYLMYGGQRRK